MPVSLGTNLAQNDDWGSARYWVNLANQLRPWGSVAAPWDEAGVALSPDGAPLADCGSFLSLHAADPGSYDYSHDGSGVLAFGGEASGQTGDGKSGTVTFGADSQVQVRLTGVKANDPPRNIRIAHSRYRGSAATFTPEFLASLAPFTTVRLMDFGRTNGSPVKEWADRCLPTGQQTTAKGVCEEHKIALARATGKDIWICIPHGASNDYIDQLAHVWGVGGTFGGWTGNLYIEYSNEVWNFGAFPQGKAVLAAAKAAIPVGSDDYERVYWYVADRLRYAVAAFRKAFGSRVRGVLAGQAVNPWWATCGLDYIEKTYGKGTAAATVYALAYGDYFYPWDTAGGAPQGDLDAVFAKTRECVAGQCLKSRNNHAILAGKYGIPNVIAYEAGQHMVGDFPVYAQAQRDPRMGDVYGEAIGQFSAETRAALWCHYSHARWWDARAGYWGAMENLSDTANPKWVALNKAAGVTATPPPVTVPPPTSQPTTQPPPPTPVVTPELTSVTVRIGDLTVTFQAGDIVKAIWK